MPYDTLLAEGGGLISQISVLLTIAFSMVMVFHIYRRLKLLFMLRKAAIPLLGFIIFGTLDAVITAKGTFRHPEMEGNPTMAAFLHTFGWVGSSISAFLWILFWMGVAAMIYKLHMARKPYRGILVTLVVYVFYSLAAGHYFAFSSWTTFMPFRDVPAAIYSATTNIASPFGPILFVGMSFGLILTAVHFAVLHALKRTGKLEVIDSFISKSLKR